MAATAIRRAIWAGFVTICGGAADRPALPTTPQVPSPVLQPVVDNKLTRHPLPEVSTVITASPSLPARRGVTPTACPPLPAGPTQNTYGEPYASVIPGSPIKNWLFYCPTSGKALPCFRPHPYVGPITGVYPCNENAATGGPDCNCPSNVPPPRPQTLRPNASQTDGPMLPQGNTPVSTAAPGHAARLVHVADRNTLPVNTLGRFRFAGRDYPCPAHYVPPARGFWNTPTPPGETAVLRWVVPAAEESVRTSAPTSGDSGKAAVLPNGAVHARW